MTRYVSRRAFLAAVTVALLGALIAGIQTWRVHELEEIATSCHQAMHEHAAWLDSHARALEP